MSEMAGYMTEVPETFVCFICRRSLPGQMIDRWASGPTCLDCTDIEDSCALSGRFRNWRCRFCGKPVESIMCSACGKPGGHLTDHLKEMAQT